MAGLVAAGAMLLLYAATTPAGLAWGAGRIRN
jgi:hypothetical protein